jgi:hypothetical protein
VFHLVGNREASLASLFVTPRKKKQKKSLLCDVIAFVEDMELLKISIGHQKPQLFFKESMQSRVKSASINGHEDRKNCSSLFFKVTVVGLNQVTFVKRYEIDLGHTRYTIPP